MSMNLFMVMKRYVDFLYAFIFCGALQGVDGAAARFV